MAETIISITLAVASKYWVLFSTFVLANIVPIVGGILVGASLLMGYMIWNKMDQGKVKTQPGKAKPKGEKEEDKNKDNTENEVAKGQSEVKDNAQKAEADRTEIQEESESSKIQKAKAKVSGAINNGVTMVRAVQRFLFEKKKQNIAADEVDKSIMPVANSLAESKIASADTNAINQVTPNSVAPVTSNSAAPVTPNSGTAVSLFNAQSPEKKPSTDKSDIQAILKGLPAPARRQYKTMFGTIYNSENLIALYDDYVRTVQREKSDGTPTKTAKRSAKIALKIRAVLPENNVNRVLNLSC
ncbi:hypothetical protein OAT84_00435 [Gammaproteobacteria bacterium]|nr:hypothetical protein [Gammaproteobacteria bacterium]